MNILVLAPHPFFQERGTPIATRALASVLGEHGHTIDVLCYHEGEDIALANSTIHRIAMWSAIRNIRPGFSTKKLVCDISMLWRARKMIRIKKYDVVHAVEEAGFVAWWLKKEFGVPFVYDMDSSLPEQMQNTFSALRVVRPLMDGITGKLVRNSVGVVAVCRALEDIARQYAPDKEIARIEDVSLITTDGQSVERIADVIGTDGPIVMYVGNLEPYQGIDLLIESFAEAASQAPTTQLVIIGGIEADIQRYRTKADGLGLSDRIHLIGPRPLSNLGGYLSQATVLVSPRIKGGNTPMKIYSYLDSGRCLLATDLETHTQVLDDEIAMLAKPEPHAMGQALSHVLRDADLRNRLAANALQRAKEHYSPQAFERKVLTFYGAVEKAISRGTAQNGTPVVPGIGSGTHG